jgi:glucose-6-phosphate 1-epimerase
VWNITGAAARLEIAAYGAHVLAWEPTHTRPVLFLSPRSQYVPGKAIRGGIPLVFPWFGPKAGDPAAAQHGFARVREWQIDGAQVEADGTAHGEFALAQDESTRAIWPHAFAVRLVVRAGRALHMALDVRNRGAVPLTFEAAFHTYFAVSDVRQIAVHGLAHTEFVERYGRPGRQRQSVEPITFAGEVDRFHVNTTGTCVIEDPLWRRRIVVAKTGSRTTVVWNPGAEKARAMADLGDCAWTGFVCVETVCAGEDAVTLAPGATHILGATISVEQD